MTGDCVVSAIGESVTVLLGGMLLLFLALVAFWLVRHVYRRLFPKSPPQTRVEAPPGLPTPLPDAPAPPKGAWAPEWQE